jgi:diguanylate cyclase (GGDEF)-like protein/PAS domain S-box-containing protein
VLRFAPGDGVDGFGLLSANGGATAMLATTEEVLLGAGFVEGLYDAADARALADALADPDRDRPPVVLRWGAAPPVDYLGMDLRRDLDGTVLAGLHDQTDRHRLEGVMAGQDVLTLVVDGMGIVRWISLRSARSVGVDPDHYLGMHSADVVHPDDRHVLGRVDRELRANPGSEIVAWWRVRNPTGDEPWSWFRNTLVSAPHDPVIGGTVVIARRVDGPPDRRADVQGPADMTVAEMMPSGLVFSAGGRLQFRNSMARRMLGPAVEAVDGYRWVDALRPGHRRQVREALMAAAGEEGRRSTVTAALDRSADETLWLRLEAMPSYDALGAHVGYAATLLDVTAEHRARDQMRQTEEQLWQLANHDALTGLPNRLHCLDRLAHALARTRREGRSTAVLFCDLDRFKQVNDQFGHAGGDALLIEIARRLRASIRETDTVSRLGGDEFVIICEAFDGIGDIEALARRLIAIVNESVPLANGLATVGLCVGIAEATAASTADGLMDRADVACYRAKQNGRNRFTTAPPDAGADLRAGGDR